MTTFGLERLQKSRKRERQRRLFSDPTMKHGPAGFVTRNRESQSFLRVNLLRSQLPGKSILLKSSRPESFTILGETSTSLHPPMMRSRTFGMKLVSASSSLPSMTLPPTRIFSTITLKSASAMSRAKPLSLPAFSTLQSLLQARVEKI